MLRLLCSEGSRRAPDRAWRSAACLLLTLLLPSLVSLDPAVAQSVDWTGLRVGRWVDAWGALENRQLQARRLRLRGPRPRHVLRGVVEPTSHRGASFALLGVEIETDGGTEWRNVEPHEVVGRSVRVDGDFFSSHRFVAARVSARSSEEPSLSGRIDAVRREPGRVTLRVLGHEVVLDEATRLEIADSSAEIPRVPSRASVGDDAYFGRDEDDILGRGLRLGGDLGLAMQHQVTFSSRDALRVDDDQGRDDSNYLFRGRLTWDPSWRALSVVELGVRGRRREDFRGELEESDVRLHEAFVLFRDVGLGLDLQVGRQDFDEPREWLYDQSLDGLRLLRRRSGLNLELSVSRTTTDVSERRASDNAILYVSNLDARHHLAAYWIYRDFDVGETRRHHLGVRALGRWLGADRSWLELSYLGGRARGRELGALGVDAGAIYRFGRRQRWSMVGGYAWGQGSASRDGIDRTFRQTGLQDNDAAFAGVASFRFYGELLDPELANLHVATLGVGVQLPMRSSLDLVAHAYRLDHPARSIVDADIDDRLDGESRDLGWEVDLVGGLASFRRWRLEVVGALFQRGEAFVGGGSASLLRLQIRYRQ